MATKKIDHDKVAKTLGAERKGVVSAKGGQLGALQTLGEVQAKKGLVPATDPHMEIAKRVFDKFDREIQRPAELEDRPPAELEDRLLKVSTFTSKDLSDEQRVAFDQTLEWIEFNQNSAFTLTFGGYAGTGKTTVLGVLAREISVGPLAFVAFTGKASSVLRRKLREAGVRTTDKTLKTSERDGYSLSSGPPYCGTLHSLIYAPVELCRCTECGMEAVDSSGTCPQFDEKTGQPCKGLFEPTGRVVGWAKRETLDRDYQLIIVDEASMVSDDMLEDLRTFGIPILAVGDHGQLPPVGGIGTLMKDPDVRLEHIHRQAAGNPIIQLSKVVRETGRLDTKLADGKHIIFDRLANLPAHIEKRYKGVDPNKLFDLGMICWTNDRRVNLNVAARKARGFEGAPRKGDQVICLRNQRNERVFNGMRALMLSDISRKVPPKDATREQLEEALEAAGGEWKPPWQIFAELDFVEDSVRGQFSMCANQFNRKYTFQSYDELLECKIRVGNWSEAGGLFDFGYALTCHKAQGSQFKDLLLIVDGPGRMGFDEYKRWLYTAITRSTERITILM